MATEMSVLHKISSNVKKEAAYAVLDRQATRIKEELRQVKILT